MKKPMSLDYVFTILVLFLLFKAVVLNEKLALCIWSNVLLIIEYYYVIFAYCFNSVVIIVIPVDIGCYLKKTKTSTGL